MSNLQISTITQNYNQTKTASPPAFRGVKTSDLKFDTVELSSNKDNNNLGTKILLGIFGVGAAVLAYVKFHKATSIKPQEGLSTELKEIQKLYKDIFSRDINAEETKDFAKRYREIIDFKTDSNDREYCEKLLEEICKDRKTNKPEIFRWIKTKAETDPRCVNGGMATAPDGSYIDIYSFNYRNMENPTKGYFESLFHETHHVKQDEIIYRTDKEFFLQHLLDKFIDNGKGEMYKDMLQSNGGNKEKTIQEIKEIISQQVDNFWGRFLPYEKNSKEYEYGLKLIDGKKNYKFFGDCANNEEYRNQIIEKGAYTDGEKAERLFDLLRQISL